MNLYAQQRLALALLLSLAAASAKDTVPTTVVSRRCLGEGKGTPHFLAGELGHSTCTFCPVDVFQTPTVVMTGAISVTLMITGTSKQKTTQSLAIAAALLNSATSVQLTLIIPPHMRGQDLELYERVFEYLPCHKLEHAKGLMTVRTIQIDSTNKQLGYRTSSHCPNAVNDVMCHVPEMPLVRAIADVLNLESDGPDLLICDPTNIAALLATEHFSIPSMIIVNDASQIKDILGSSGSNGNNGSSSNNGHAAWSVLGWWFWIADILNERYWSLSWTANFISLNKLRVHAGMRPLRTFQDLWKVPATVIATTCTPQYGLATDASDLHLVSIPAPLLPPCLACSKQDAIKKQQRIESDNVPEVVITAHWNPIGLMDARHVLQGLATAQASIQEFHDDCGWDEYSDSCWNGPTNFTVVWLAPDGATPPVMPTFVKVHHDGLLDHIALSNNTRVIATHSCGDDKSWIHGLGPAILCLDRAWSPHDLAKQVLRLLRKPPPAAEHPTQGDGMKKLVDLIENTALISKRNRHQWKTTAEMTRILDENLWEKNRGAPEKHGGRTFPICVFLAWFVFIWTSVYVVVGKMMPPSKTTRLRKHRNYQKPTFAAVVDEVAFRLPELEQAWDLWIDWCEQTIAQASDPVARERGDGSKDASTHTHTLRKRRPTKKRH